MYPNKKSRIRLINWQQNQLFMPRFQMSLILAITGLIGFFSSFLLLHSGVSQMWLRYPIAIMSAYAAFLLLLRVWLAFQRFQGSSDLRINFDLPVESISRGTASPNSDFSFGSGGDFSGGGSGGTWGEGVSSSLSSFSDKNAGDSMLDGIAFDLDLEEIGLLILAIVLLLGGLLATLYVVYIAPALLSEILVDGLLLSRLYKRVKNIERKHWLQTAVSKTLFPALLCVLFSGVIGGVLHTVAPKANSIGEVWSALTTDKTVK